MQSLEDPDWHQIRITHTRQSHKPHPLRKSADQFASQLQSEARFATAARPNERHQAHFGASEPLLQSLNRPFSSNEARRRRRKVVLGRGRAGVVGGNWLSTSRCKCTERWCLPFVVTKDVWGHLCHFAQVEYLILGGNPMPACHYSAYPLYFHTSPTGVPAAMQFPAEYLWVYAKRIC